MNQKYEETFKRIYDAANAPADFVLVDVWGEGARVGVSRDTGRFSVDGVPGSYDTLEDCRRRWDTEQPARGVRLLVRWALTIVDEKQHKLRHEKSLFSGLWQSRGGTRSWVGPNLPKELLDRVLAWDGGGPFSHVHWVSRGESWQVAVLTTEQWEGWSR